MHPWAAAGSDVPTGGSFRLQGEGIARLSSEREESRKLSLERKLSSPIKMVPSAAAESPLAARRDQPDSRSGSSGVLARVTTSDGLALGSSSIKVARVTFANETWSPMTPMRPSRVSRRKEPEAEQASLSPSPAPAPGASPTDEY